MSKHDTDTNAPILQVKNLVTSFQVEGGDRVKAIRGVSFDLRPGETLGIIGESGCGKSVTSLSVMRLIPKPIGKIESGEVLFQGQDLMKMNIDDVRKIRGKDISMIFQDPMTSLNPVLTIGEQLMEAILFHESISKKDAWDRSIKLIEEVGISDADSRMKNYPHELSGGMRQRIMIAMALACNPSILIADEPTTALDVTIQGQILQLLKKLQKKHNMAMIFITHDLGVVAQVCDSVMVMYAGMAAEKAKVEDLFQNPAHPYTAGLLRSVLSAEETKDKRLETIEGMVPSLTDLPKGCAFQNRCPEHSDQCSAENPKFEEVAPSHSVACHHHLFGKKS